MRQKLVCVQASGTQRKVVYHKARSSFRAYAMAVLLEMTSVSDEYFRTTAIMGYVPHAVTP
jgi:hypothetical protein